MAIQNGVVVHGLRETIRTLEKFGVEVADMKAAFKRIGTLVSNQAQSMAPRRSGKLAGSIRPSNTKNKSVVRAGGAKIPYAGVIHFGGYNNIEANPFLTSALQAKQGEVVQQLDTELRGLIHQLGLNN